MDSEHPHSGATYRILEQSDGYRVEVSIPGASPVIVSGMPTLERAERWVAAHKQKVEAGAPKRTFPGRRLPHFLVVGRPLRIAAVY
jgi:hypothetical protein